MKIDPVLLLIAAYIRKTNHPTETQAELAANVQADLRQVVGQMRGIDPASVDIMPSAAPLPRK